IDVESSPPRQRELLQRQWTALALDAAAVKENVDVFVSGNPHDQNSRELDRILTKGTTHQRWNWLFKLLQLRRYDLIVVDTALTFSPFNAADEEKVRQLFAWVSILRRTEPFPAVILVVHLRKPDRKSRGPTLLQDPYGWTEEILGSVVWS